MATDSAGELGSGESWKRGSRLPLRSCPLERRSQRATIPLTDRRTRDRNGIATARCRRGVIRERLVLHFAAPPGSFNRAIRIPWPPHAPVARGVPRLDPIQERNGAARQHVGTNRDGRTTSPHRYGFFSQPPTLYRPSVPEGRGSIVPDECVGGRSNQIDNCSSNHACYDSVGISQRKESSLLFSHYRNLEWPLSNEVRSLLHGRGIWEHG